MRTVSEAAGYSVLKGYKEFGVPLPTKTFAQVDHEMQDESANSDANGQNAEEPRSNILGKDLISMARNSQFNDFRLRRDISTRVQEKTLKGYKDPKEI